MADLATKAGVEGRQRLQIHTPLIRMTKAEIIRTGVGLGVDYGLTLSCYEPAPAGACGRCDACVLRLRGFAEAGLSDPVAYRADSTGQTSPDLTSAGAGPAPPGRRRPRSSAPPR